VSGREVGGGTISAPRPSCNGPSAALTKAPWHVHYPMQVTRWPYTGYIFVCGSVQPMLCWAHGRRQLCAARRIGQRGSAPEITRLAIGLSSP
jgi:hypothetical protein